MYYYIMEPPKGKTVLRQEKIKDILGDLGIAGETVIPSAARTIEELTRLGVLKGYSTIVACGKESLANKVITVLANLENSKDVVLGIIPDNFESALAQKIGINDVYSACNALKLRKLETIDLVLIEPNQYFLTEAVIETFRNQKIYFSMEKLKGKALANRVIIKPGLELYILDKTLTGGKTQQFFRWLFGKKEKDIYSSYFHPKKLRLESDHNLPIKVSEEIVARTPVNLYNRSKVLKIIVARDKIKSKA